MKKLSIGATLLALVVIVVGCAKYGSTAKEPANKEKTPATSTTEHQTTAPVEHKTMKPVTPSTGTEYESTTPADTKPEAAKPEAKQPKAKPEGGTATKTPVSKETPKENK